MTFLDLGTPHHTRIGPFHVPITYLVAVAVGWVLATLVKLWLDPAPYLGLVLLGFGLGTLIARRSRAPRSRTRLFSPLKRRVSFDP